MSIEKHDDNCPGCKPVLCDKDMNKLPDNSPEMAAVLAVWDQTNLLERQAWHRATCQNSQIPGDLKIAKGLAARFGQAIKGINHD